MKILISGSAGFIGFHAVKKFLELGHEVVGIDNINDYYDTNLKESRLQQISSTRFKFIKADFADNLAVKIMFLIESYTLELKQELDIQSLTLMTMSIVI